MDMFNSCQFIALNLPSQPQWTNDDFTKGRYMGLEDDKNDIDARIDFLKRCMKKAYRRADKNKKCLKIFAMPEFFFRGKNGAYPIELSEYLIKKLKALTVCLPGNISLLDWLFVFGTAVFYSTDKTNNKEIYNICIIHSGGPPSQKLFKPPLQNKLFPIKHDIFIVMKDLLSNYDFFGKVNHMASVSLSAPGKERQKRNYDGNCIFEYCGIKFGVEICLDHYRGRLIQSPPNQWQSNVNLQLVISAGLASAEPDNLIADNYAFWCDGRFGESKSYSRSNNSAFGQKQYNSNSRPIDDFIAIKTKDKFLFDFRCKNHKKCRISTYRRMPFNFHRFSSNDAKK
ncbi:MAG: hypothetical protein GY710_06545 [Desulfobacteraceae bacterium]|nr:hypothetical protein [Desulfobacteraceae bacterium]